MSLPDITTPADLAQRLGWSERHVRSEARRLGACRVLGNRMILLPEDVRIILEATKCPSSSTLAAKSGTTAARLPAIGYEDLARQRTRPSRRVRLPKSKSDFRDMLVKDINAGTIKQMAIELFPHYSGASKNRVAIVPTQAIINHAAELQLCPPIRVRRFEEETKEKIPATMDWVKTFMAASKPHLGAYALFMFLTGCRPGEAVNVHWDDVDLEARTVLLRETKGGTERLAHLPEPLAVVLANLVRIKGRGVFVYKAYGDFQHAWDDAIERAGIKRLTPHCMRHGFATELLRRGVDVLTVAHLGGWKDAGQVLRTYGHANKNRKLTDLLIDPPVTQSVSHETGKVRKTGPL